VTISEAELIEIERDVDRLPDYESTATEIAELEDALDVVESKAGDLRLQLARFSDFGSGLVSGTTEYVSPIKAYSHRRKVPHRHARAVIGGRLGACLYTRDASQGFPEQLSGQKGSLVGLCENLSPSGLRHLGTFWEDWCYTFIPR
jgi:hypothetical protein